METATEQALRQKSYQSETQWIADNQASRKIAYTAHTGDVIENDYYNPLAKNADGSLQRPGLDAELNKELAISSSYRNAGQCSGL